MFSSKPNHLKEILVYRDIPGHMGFYVAKAQHTHKKTGKKIVEQFYVACKKHEDLTVILKDAGFLKTIKMEWHDPLALEVWI